METDLHLYEKVVKDIKQRLKSGEFSIGTRLPPIRDLSTLYACNYHTIRRALKDLSDVGIIDSKKGSGTYIKSNPEAEKLKAEKNRQKKITVILMTEETPYSHALYGHIQNLAYEKNLQLEWQFALSLEALACDQRQLSNLMGDVVLVPWFRETEGELAVLDDIEKKIGRPIVCHLNRRPDDPHCFRTSNAIGQDSYKASQIACEYFSTLGYTALIMAGNSNEAYDSIEFRYRLNGFQDYCMDHPVQNLVYLYEKNHPEVRTLLRFIERHKGRVGIVAYHDDLAIRLMHHLGENRVNIPDDVGIIGFNNHLICESLTPTLSSISIPFKDIAAAMMNHTLALLENRSEQLNHPLTLHLHLRQSCGGMSKFSPQEFEELRLKLEAMK